MRLLLLLWALLFGLFDLATERGGRGTDDAPVLATDGLTPMPPPPK